MHDVPALPSGPLAAASLPLVHAAASAPIAGHSIRTFCYARPLAGHDGRLTEAAYNEDLLFAACTTSSWALSPRGIPAHALLQRVSCLQMPVFVANGDSDPMILPHYSYLLAGRIPQARVKIYPDSAHGFLFKHHAEFAADVEAFLSDSREP